MATEDLSIEGLYLTSTVRQMLVQHIIALNIQATIFMPLYIGLDVTTGAAVQKIIDKLFLDRTPPLYRSYLAYAVETHLQWRQAVIRHLSNIVNQQNIAMMMQAQLRPVLEALFPRSGAISTWPSLVAIIQELIMTMNQLKSEKDFYCPYFPTRGGPKTDYMDVSGHPVGGVFVCLFPGVVKRFWVEQRQSWLQGALIPAMIAMESALTEE
jgi:hypothetical protein